MPATNKHLWTWVGSLFVAAAIAAALAFYVLKDDFFGNQKNPAAVVENSTNKLRLEILKTPTAASEFKLKDLAGKQVNLRELKGNVVLLNFWATWCPPCIEEMPAMEKLHRELGKAGLVVLAVNFQEGPEPVKKFLTEHNLTFTVLLDRDGKVAELYQAWALPVSVVINKRGEIAARAMGSQDWHGDEALGLFRTLLAEGP